MITHREAASPPIAETAASGETAEIYADIRATLGTSVVNLIWRNLATLPGALPWTWAAVRPLYAGAGLPRMPRRCAARWSRAAVQSSPPTRWTAAGVDVAALSAISAPRSNSYYHTNALALVVLSALLERYDPSAGEPASRPAQCPRPARPSSRRCH